MAKFTNYTSGPKGVHGVNGLVYVDPGKTLEIEVSKEEAASAKKTGWFTAPKAVEAPKDDELTDAEVLALLNDEEKAAYEKLDDAAKAQFLADKKAS